MQHRPTLLKVSVTVVIKSFVMGVVHSTGRKATPYTLRAQCEDAFSLFTQVYGSKTGEVDLQAYDYLLYHKFMRRISEAQNASPLAGACQTHLLYCRSQVVVSKRAEWSVYMHMYDTSTHCTVAYFHSFRTN